MPTGACGDGLNRGYRFDQELGLDVVEDMRVHSPDRMRRLFALVLLSAQIVFVIGKTYCRKDHFFDWPNRAHTQKYEPDWSCGTRGTPFFGWNTRMNFDK